MPAPKVRVNDERYCQYCFERMIQGENEAAYNYLKRNTCNKQCGNLLFRERNKVKKPSDASRLGLSFRIGAKV